MASLNKVILIGNLGADPETRYMPDGTCVCNIRIATTETWKDKNTGEKKEATEWHRISFWGKLGEIAGQYLHKGSQVYVEGRLQTRKYQDKDTGADRYSTEIRGDEMKMLGRKGDGAEGGDGGDSGYDQRPPQESRPAQQQPQSRPAQQPQPRPAPQPAAHSYGGSGGGFNDFDDDIPFAFIGRGMASHCI